jgi:hypothetical protein
VFTARGLISPVDYGQSLQVPKPASILAGGFFFGMLTEIVLFVAQKSYERVY